MRSATSVCGPRSGGPENQSRSSQEFHLRQSAGRGVARSRCDGFSAGLVDADRTPERRGGRVHLQLRVAACSSPRPAARLAICFSTAACSSRPWQTTGPISSRSDSANFRCGGGNTPREGFPLALSRPGKSRAPRHHRAATRARAARCIGGRRCHLSNQDPTGGFRVIRKSKSRQLRVPATILICSANPAALRCRDFFIRRKRQDPGELALQFDP